MLGATVMPHAIYVHSALARDRHGRAADPERKVRLLRATRWDVIGALGVAGVVNVAMLLLAATSLRGHPGTDTIEGAHAAVVAALGPGIGLVFAIGLLASGLASTSVGCYAGATIMQGLLHRNIPLLARRVDHHDPGAGAPRPGRGADLGAGGQPGGAQLRHPLRARPAAGADQRPAAHGRRR